MAAGWSGLRQFEAALLRDYRVAPEKGNSNNSCFVSPLALQHVLSQSGIWLTDAALKDFALGLGADSNGHVDACEALQAFEDALLAAESSGFSDIISEGRGGRSFHPQALSQADSISSLIHPSIHSHGEPRDRAPALSRDDFMDKLTTMINPPSAEDATRAGEECITQALLLPGLRTQSPAAISRRFTAPLLSALQQRLNDPLAHAHDGGSGGDSLQMHSGGVSFLPLPLFAEALYDMGFDLSHHEATALGLQFCGSASGGSDSGSRSGPPIARTQVKVQSFLSWLFSHLPGMQVGEKADEHAGDAATKKGPQEWWEREPALATQLAQCLNSFNDDRDMTHSSSSNSKGRSGRYLAREHSASFMMQLRTKLEQFDRRGVGSIGKWQLGACLEEV